MANVIPTARDLRGFVKHSKQLQKRIKKAKNSKARRNAMSAFVRSRSAKMTALNQARMKRRMPLSEVDWSACDKRLDLKVPDPLEKAEVVLLTKETTEGDKLRYTLSFGVWHTARQILLKTVLEKIHVPHAAQFLLKGGRDAATRRVQEYYAEGFLHIVEVDLNSAFHSFGSDGIAQMLGIPENWVETTLGGFLLKLSLSKSTSESMAEAINGNPCEMSKLEEFTLMNPSWLASLEGLTEGNCASPVACEILLAWLCEKLPQDWPSVRLVNYADNFLVMATCAKDAHTAATLLQEYLSEHPAAPPNKTITASTDVAKLGQPFSFLGYWMCPQEGKLRAVISEKGRKKLKSQRRKAYSALGQPLASPSDRAEILNEVWFSHEAVLSGYRLWAEGRSSTIKAFLKMHIYAQGLGLNTLKLSKRLSKMLAETEMT